MFFNKETGIILVYRLDSYMDVGQADSLLRYAKGDGGLPDYALILSLTYQARTSWDRPTFPACSTKFPSSGTDFTDCSCP